MKMTYCPKCGAKLYPNTAGYYCTNLVVSFIFARMEIGMKIRGGTICRQKIIIALIMK